VDNNNPWVDKANILRLIELVPLDDVTKIHACYLTTKSDPSVFLDPPKKVPTHQQSKARLIDEDSRFYWRSRRLVEEYKQDKSCTTTQTKLFKYMTSHVCYENVPRVTS